MHDIIIVGAGTAGLAAAIYGVRAGKTVLVLEGATYGGQIINTPEIENYPGIKKISGFEFAAGLYEQATGLGAEVAFAQVAGIRDGGESRIVIADGKEYPCKAVILATGTKNTPLGLAREEELIGRGVSYCATCDGAFFKKKAVAVAGGGNTALEDAAFLSGYCERVYVVHRRDAFRGERRLVEALEGKPNVEFVLETVITDILGEKKVEGLRLKNKRTGEVRELQVDGLFVAVGQSPSNGVFSPPVELDGGGYIVAGEDCRTNVPWVFAAGDCRTKTVRQLATAAADGAVSALKAFEYVG